MRAKAFFCGLLAGAIILLLLAGGILAWFFLPVYFDFNATWILLFAAVLAPFVAGFAAGAVNGAAPLRCGFWLGLLLWFLQALPLYLFLPELFYLRPALAWCAASLILAMFGASCGLHIARIRADRKANNQSLASSAPRE